MEKKRYIFDLDGTLLTADYSFEKDFFHSLYGEDASLLLSHIETYLEKFERSHIQYDIDSLAKYLSKKTGLSVSKKVVCDWINLIGEVPDTMEEGVFDLLENLKQRDKSLVVLTNWFSKSQESRLRRAGIYSYFDAIYSGEYVLKPHEVAYICARGSFNPSECVLIGDNLENDYIGPRAAGIESILYDKNDCHHNSLVKVKRMNDVIHKF